MGGRNSLPKIFYDEFFLLNGLATKQSPSSHLKSKEESMSFSLLNCLLLVHVSLELTPKTNP